MLHCLQNWNDCQLCMHLQTECKRAPQSENDTQAQMISHNLGWRVHSQGMHCASSWCKNTFPARNSEGKYDEGCNRHWDVHQVGWNGMQQRQYQTMPWELSAIGCMKCCHGWVPNRWACCPQLQYGIGKVVGKSNSANPSRCPCKFCRDCIQAHKWCNTWGHWNRPEPNDYEMEAAILSHRWQKLGWWQLGPQIVWARKVHSLNLGRNTVGRESAWRSNKKCGLEERCPNRICF